MCDHYQDQKKKISAAINCEKKQFGSKTRDRNQEIYQNKNHGVKVLCIYIFE